MRGLRPIWTGLLYMLEDAPSSRPQDVSMGNATDQPSTRPQPQRSFPLTQRERGSGGEDYRPNLLTARELGPKFGPRSGPYALGRKQDMKIEHRARSYWLRGVADRLASARATLCSV